jgi:hypothetical protein
MQLYNVQLVFPCVSFGPGSHFARGPQVIKTLPYDSAAQAARALNRDLPKLLKAAGQWPDGARFEVSPVKS